MLSWIRKTLPSIPWLAVAGVIGFVAGQFFPVYFEHAEGQRQAAVALIDTVTANGNALEGAIPPLMEVAGNQADYSYDRVKALDTKMLELFQSIESVKVRFPDSAKRQQEYVDAMLHLKSAAAHLSGPLDAREFVEAASQFKKARTDYEAQLSELKPSFLTAMLTSF